MSKPTYYDTNISETVTQGNKRYRISKRDGVPYVTYKRKTRVLWQLSGLTRQAYINVGPDKVFFL